MKTQNVLLGAVLGLGLGLIISRWIVRPMLAADESMPGTSLSSASERRRVATFSRILELRDSIKAPDTAGEYLESRAVKTGSPYRAMARDVAALETLPLEEILVLLEAGELSGGEQIRKAFSLWANADPVAAYHGLRRFNLPPDDQQVAREVVFGHWAKTNPQELLRMLYRMPQDNRRGSDAWDLMTAWGKASPEQALQFVDRLVGLGQWEASTSIYQRIILTSWLEQDEKGALKWLEKFPDGEEKVKLEKEMTVVKLSFMESRDAAEWILEQGEGSPASDWLLTHLHRWSEQDPKAALKRVIEIPSDQKFWNGQATNIAQKALENALSMKKETELIEMVQALPETESRRKLIQGMIQGASASNLPLARELLDDLPESEERNQAAIHYSQFLTSKDPVAAGEWLLSMEDSYSRDIAVGNFASLLVTGQPEIAAEWADSIADPARAKRARYDVHSQWREVDPAAADEWKSGWDAGDDDEVE